MFINSLPAHLNGRLARPIFLTICTLALLATFNRNQGPAIRDPGFASPTVFRPLHPIQDLMSQADAHFQSRLRKQSTTLQEAVEAYRHRRGRHPPPAFDVWFKYAQDRSAIILEDLFDQIDHDTGPFWGVPARQIREQANDYKPRVSVRAGKVSFGVVNPSDKNWAFLKNWGDVVASIAKYLPDLDMPINQMDEPRILAPWEDINECMQKEAASRRLVDPTELKTQFASYPYVDQQPPVPFDPEFNGDRPYWSKYVRGCHPESQARNATVLIDWSGPPDLHGSYPEGSHNGYVQNWTFARSPCLNPAMQDFHGTFVDPLSIATSQKLFPLFGGSKLPMNNDILIPAAVYWSKSQHDQELFAYDPYKHERPWSEKKPKMIWRGVTSGGHAKKDNWPHFHRHRFVSMMNGTTVGRAEAGIESAPNFVLPAGDNYGLASAFKHSIKDNSDGLDRVRGGGGLGDWLATFTDVGFTSFSCFPAEDENGCSYTNAFHSKLEHMPLMNQFENKYLPDIDGNSYSGRYRAFLLSNSLPIKATIYSEWHDSRLVPWKHFVPMHNTFIDIYGILKYFLGDERNGLAGHDEDAERIATDGKDWAERVLREEDMDIYVFRLLLEYARICDDDRDIMGWRET